MASANGNDPAGVAVAILAFLTLPLGLLTWLLFGMQIAAVVVAVVLLLVPIPLVRSELLGAGSPEAESSDPIDELKNEYVNGNIDEKEFDRRVAGLVGPEDANGRDVTAGVSERRTDEVEESEFER